MKTSDMKLGLTGMMLALMLLWTPNSVAATPASWKDTGLSINANGMTLRDVLTEFGRTYGVRLSISANDGKPVKGRLKADNGAEFLDRLSQEYKFRWFVYNDTLYVVPRDDNTSLRLEVGEDAVQDAKAALVGLGLFDNRFGWGELPDEGVVIVSGPRAYVNLARDMLMPKEEKVAKGKQVMLFRLKYASANDRVMNVRGKQETIPGVKTVLSNLLGNGMQEKANDANGRFDAGSTKRSRQPKNGRGDVQVANGGRTAINARAQRENEEDDNVERHARLKTPHRDERPRIEAESSLNAIMIYDNVSKREMYKSLIAELDVEPQQIEIEALIVDIDRSKLSEMGVEWSVRSGNTVGTFNSTMSDSRGVDLPLPGATLLISNAARFYARLKAMEGSGDARVLAKPTVLTLDNVAAVLDLSQTSYVPLVGERVADLADITAGTMLRVVPRIVREGDRTKVRLEVDIEDGSLGDQSVKANVTRSTISTQAIIDMQQTLMIGGYHAESVINKNQKVPVLGDVPLFGNLFRSNSENHSTRERLFLITPRLSGSDGAPAPSTSTMSRAGRKVAEQDYRREKPVPLPALATPSRETIPAQPVPATEPAAPVSMTASKLAAEFFAKSEPAKVPAKKKCARPRGTRLLSADPG